MEMKFEFNYGFKRIYQVKLFGDACGKDKKTLAKIIETPRTGKGRSLLDNWQKSLGKHTQIVYWYALEERAFSQLQAELESIGAKPEVCEISIYRAFEGTTISQDFPRRYARQLERRKHEPEAIVKAWLLDREEFKNDWWSGGLTKLNEYAFSIWAKTYGIEEAYRLTLLPSFDNSQVMRMWLKDGRVYFVHKEGVGEYDCEPVLNKNSQTFLNSDTWDNLKQFMDKNFWTAEAWYGRGVNDGIILLFEGWKDGEYKLLDDHSPEKDKIAFKAQAIFEQIKSSAT